MLAPHAVVTALAGSPSEEPIAVIYGSSDVHESAPLPLTNPQGDSCHVSVSEGWMDGWIDWGGGEVCVPAGRWHKLGAVDRGAPSSAGFNAHHCLFSH